MYFCRPEHPQDVAAIRAVLETAFPTPAEARLGSRPIHEARLGAARKRGDHPVGVDDSDAMPADTD